MGHPLRGPEKIIEYEILGFLRTIGVFSWKHDRQGTYDPVKGVFRSNKNPYKIKGVSDILGIMFGKFIAIEVKSEKGTISPDQRRFLARVNNEGGIGIVSRSLDQFLTEIAKHFPAHQEFQLLVEEYVKSRDSAH